jgi:hypothetical protein
LAAKPIAAPAIAAPRSGPALSPHEKALRLLLLRLSLRRFSPDLPRLDEDRDDVRLPVRVAINSSLSRSAIQRTGEMRRSAREP